MKAAVPLPCLCLVTDRAQCDGRSLESVVQASVNGGANLVQLREKDLASGALYDLALRIREITRGKALMFVNDRVDIAMASGADGVQLGETSMPVDAVRRIAGSGMLVGRSVHSVESALMAQAQGADALVLGTVFPTGSHPGGPTGGLDLVRRVTGAVAIPVIAIGGINSDNAASVMESGASGVAVITALTRAASPRSAAKVLRARLEAVTVPERRRAPTERL